MEMCPVCAHSQLVIIEVELVGGTAPATLADMFGVTVTALRAHQTRCMRPARTRQGQTRAPRPEPHGPSTGQGE